MIKSICFFVFLLCISGMSVAESYVYLGAYTRHMVPDKDYNEDNRIRALEFVHPVTRWSVGVSAFTNSFGTESWAYSIGKRNQVGNFKIGSYLMYVGGYDDHVITHYNGYLFVPAVSIGVKYLRTIVVPGAVNIGLELPLKM